MKSNAALYLWIIGALNLTGLSVQASTIFQDSFESGNLSTTNADGFRWERNNRTSTVTQSPTDGPVAIYNNKTIYNIHSATMPDGTTRNWAAKMGSNSMRFNYSAGQNYVEHRYDFGKGYPEIWVGYWIRVPSNYKRVGSSNNKWFNIQMAPMTEYLNTTVSRIEMQDWPDANNSMKINIQFRNGSDGSYKNSNTYSGFVKPADAGRWMHIVYHLKASSTTSSTDGLIRMYRKWEGESDYTLINNLSNINAGIGAGSVSTGYLGWGAGYLMGWANSPYVVDTEWLLDHFTLSTTPLIKAPSAPTSLTTTP